MHLIGRESLILKVLLKDDGNVSVLNIERLGVINSMAHTL